MGDRRTKPSLRHKPFYTATALAVAALLPGIRLAGSLAAEITAITFFIVYLLLTGLRVRRLTAQNLKDSAAETDEPVAIIFLITLGVIVVSVVSLFALINGKPDISSARLGLSLAAVTLGWFTIHTMAALHYAHVYWLSHKKAGNPRSGETGSGGGLDFPGTDAPGVADFLYFSFVIGMTAQTSDVAITSSAMRRLNLAHAVVSYFFNTVLIAAAVNVAVSLAN